MDEVWIVPNSRNECILHLNCNIEFVASSVVAFFDNAEALRSGNMRLEEGTYISTRLV